MIERQGTSLHPLMGAWIPHVGRTGAPRVHRCFWAGRDAPVVHTYFWRARILRSSTDARTLGAARVALKKSCAIPSKGVPTEPAAGRAPDAPSQVACVPLIIRPRVTTAGAHPCSPGTPVHQLRIPAICMRNPCTPLALRLGIRPAINRTDSNLSPGGGTSWAHGPRHCRRDASRDTRSVPSREEQH